MSRKFYTTVEVAKAAGVKRPTLQHWIKTGKISPPPVRLLRNRAVRLWTDAQKERIRRLRGTFKSGPQKKESTKK
jgi:DNA-binding transcriptional MerR regulator